MKHAVINNPDAPAYLIKAATTHRFGPTVIESDACVIVDFGTFKIKSFINRFGHLILQGIP